jgi:hypothetical protein
VSKYFQASIKIGAVFGIVMGIMHFIVNQQLVSAVIMGLLYGLFFGVGIVLMSWWSEKRLNGLGFSTTNMNPIQQREIYINQPLAQAIEESRDALLIIPKLHILSVDTADRLILAKVGITWSSWGESVTVSFMPRGNGTSACICSRPRLRFTLVDYGKGVENVEIFVRGLVRANPNNHILGLDQS